MMQEKVGRNRIKRRLVGMSDPFEHVAGNSFHPPPKARKVLLTFTGDSFGAVKDDKFHIRPVSRQTPRNSQHKRPVPSANIEHAARLRSDVPAEQARHDRCMEHQSVDALQITPGSDR